uniref:Calreticulin n=1 Tax=Iconisemion striatum TaxID=60296 RepID=A0A1A7Z436_9TELE
MGKMQLLGVAVVILAVYCVNAKIYFREEFLDGDEWRSRWVNSKHKSDYGEWKLTAGNFYGDAEKDKGLQTSQDARFYATSAHFEAFSNEGKPLVIQFTVKHEQKIDCGGGYVKVFPADLDQTDMHGESSYYIMFGPDICGYSTKKVHVIFNYKGQNHLIKKEIKCKDDELTHLYTLILNPDQTYEVKIDNEKVESGSLEDDWDFLPPKKIKDPEAKKPEDWDDRPKIDDVNDKKPEDWDKPENIPDPDAKKPEDWDEDMDGEWEPPMIPNPEYKGEWKPKQMDNPDYKGAWIHPEIDNPEYSPDSNIYKFEKIGVLGLDLWQVKSGTIFDNFLIGDDVKEAEEVGKETWGVTKEPEKKMKQEQDDAKRKEEEAKVKEQETNEEGEEEEEEEEPEEEEVVGSGVNEEVEEQVVPVVPCCKEEEEAGGRQTAMLLSEESVQAEVKEQPWRAPEDARSIVSGYSTLSTLGRSLGSEGRGDDADDEHSELVSETDNESGFASRSLTQERPSKQTPPNPAAPRSFLYAHCKPPVLSPTPLLSQPTSITHTPNSAERSEGGGARSTTPSSSSFSSSSTAYRLHTRPSFNSHKLIQCDTLARKKLKSEKSKARSQERLEFQGEGSGSGSEGALRARRNSSRTNPSSASSQESLLLSRSKPALPPSEVTSFTPTGASGRSLAEHVRARLLGSADDLRSVGMRKQPSPETRRKKRAWRRHTVVASPSETSEKRPPLIVNDFPLSPISQNQVKTHGLTQGADGLDPGPVPRQPPTSRFHQYL